MKGKKETIVSVAVVAGVLMTLIFYLRGAGDIDVNELSLVAITVVLVALAMYIVWDRIRNLRIGLPAKDERVMNISYKAGYYGFIAAIWSAVFAPMVVDIVWGREMDGGDVTAVVVLVSGFVFVVTYLYLSGRGEN